MKRKYDIPKTYELDSEVVDRMAIHSLKDHYNMLVGEMDNFVLHQKGHPDDYERNTELRKALEIVLDYYGV
jgi:hypothetical protein